jgi:TonB family protein
MIASWMLYVLAVGALVSLGALALERAMRAFALSQRWVWAAAMVLTLAIPAAARWMPREAEPAPAAAALGAVSAGLGAPVAAEADRGFDPAVLDRPLLTGWFGSGLGTLLALGAASLVLARRRRGWRPARVDGVPVLLSPETGPAVVGLFRSRIVLPAWVLDADADARALLLEHEREHLRAGDPRLLALGLAMVVLAPWNAAAWYQLRRLRLAIEIDCDARVLARRADVRAYGSLLLEVGRRASSGGRLVAAAAFSEPASFLERRIRVMSSRMQRPRARVVVPALVLCAAVAGAMRAVPAPAVPLSAPGTLPAVQAERPASAAAARDTTKPVIVNAQAIVRALNREYPPMLRAAGTEGTASVRITVSAEGVPVEVQALESTHAAFGEAAVRAMQEARFRPARHDGTPVAFTLILPVQFQLSRGETPPIASSTPAAAPAWDQPPMPTNVDEITRALRAEYPPQLRAAGIAAQAQVRLRVSETGEVLRAAAESASHPEAGPAAERALRRARFRPARKDGRPVAAEVVLPVMFQLDPAVAP